MDKALEILQNTFGYSSFRPGQEKVINALLTGQDTFAVMPTGAGKSLCYQIPAMLRPGIALVISPLVSLMKDQVTALSQMGISAAYVNSSLTYAAIREILDDAQMGRYKLIYVAPERLTSTDFLRFVHTSPITSVSIDEAHCVSQWGQDFRPGYLDIRPFIESFPARPVIGAFTATATEAVRRDITELLGLQNPCRIVTGFDRKNLHFEVRRPGNKKREILNIVRHFKNKSGIIYCATRKKTESVYQTLVKNNIRATLYHAGLSDSDRNCNQDDFINDTKDVIVATNAFGMGIDKSDVSYVVHYNMPSDIESYYQEAGRAGRDGEPADCILLYGAEDVTTQLFFLKHIGEGTGSPYIAREQQLIAGERLKDIIRYCLTPHCLRAKILRYFGEECPDACGNCSNCEKSFKEVDLTIPAQKILSCVYRLRENWGVGMVIDVLRGSKNARLLENGFDSLSTYNIMNDTSEPELREMIRFLISEDYLHPLGGGLPILKLGSRSGEILFERKPLTALLPVRNMHLSKKKQNAPLPVIKQEKKSIDSPLFVSLKYLRDSIAVKEGLPPFVIFTDTMLADMCETLPSRREELFRIPGVTPTRVEKYAEIFLEKIIAYRKELGLPAITSVGTDSSASSVSDAISAGEAGHPRSSVDADMFELLRNRCKEIADEQGVPAYVLFTNATLHAMCRDLPVTTEEFAKLPGVGEVKLERYADKFIPLLSQLRRERGRAEDSPSPAVKTSQKKVSECSGDSTGQSELSPTLDTSQRIPTDSSSLSVSDTKKTSSHSELMTRLKKLRGHLSESENVPRQQIFSDTELITICETLPGTSEDLSQKCSISPLKIKRYGPAVLGIIAIYKKEKNISQNIPTQTDLYDRLHALRDKIASREKIPSFCVFTNATLADISEIMPGSLEEFAEIPGISANKIEKYGDEFMKIININ